MFIHLPKVAEIQPTAGTTQDPLSLAVERLRLVPYLLDDVSWFFATNAAAPVRRGASEYREVCQRATQAIEEYLFLTNPSHTRGDQT